MIRIFHPGFASVEGGPDFRGAVLQIGDDAPRSGDVEIDLRPGGWRAHGHDRNPNFKNVILHAVWETGAPPSGGDQTKNRPATGGTDLQMDRPPTLALSQSLDAPLGELSLSLDGEPLRTLPKNLRGKCCAQLRELDETQLANLLGEAAQVRFESKAGQFRARARNGGWEQSLWEGLFRALGYKHNGWPMQNIAEQQTRLCPASPQFRSGNVIEVQARLFGVSGLLPAELARAQKSGDNYLRQIWDCWWRARDEFSDCILPRTIWKFHGLRPANHPQRRLALAAHWLAGKNLVARLEKWCAAELPDKKMRDSLHEIFQAGRDEFWSWHWTFRAARLKKMKPLLGGSRVTDLAVNVVLPWLWIRAVEGKNEKLQCAVGRRYFAWPAAGDNSILKLARQRLLGTGQSRALRNAAAQQGLMQITGDFCGHSNAVCENCGFPELVRNWRLQSPKSVVRPPA
jgi:hypothetical protein